MIINDYNKFLKILKLFNYNRNPKNDLYIPSENFVNRIKELRISDSFKNAFIIKKYNEYKYKDRPQNLRIYIWTDDASYTIFCEQNAEYEKDYDWYCVYMPISPKIYVLKKFGYNYCKLRGIKFE